ncbi:hypothetical protein PYW07_010049 [Mythimna separata]|uniref:MICOS complex subunit MIC60 n=1 Tax=Mythimna separata TaxID=271217 RepID=A0AAD7YHF7_MYTSE|nr:hypothetical protein PYW07_010049 [Mythimna separata]
MLKSIPYALSAKKLFTTRPLLSRLQQRQPCISVFNLNRYPADYQIATFTRTPVNYFPKYQDPKERDTCPPPELPPPKPPKDDKMFWGTIALLMLAAGFVVYAKDNPELRDWLTLNAAWLDELIAILHQENMTYGEFAASCIRGGQKMIDDFTGKNKPKKCSIDGEIVKDVPEEPKAEETKKPCEETKKTKVEDKKKDDSKYKEVCEKLPSPVITKNICEIEKCLLDLSDCVLNNYYTAKQACVVYNKLVLDTMQAFTYKGLKELQPAMEERKALIKEALKHASDCIHKIDEMIRYIDCGVLATKDQIKNTKMLYEELKYKFKKNFVEYMAANDLSLELDKQWPIVEDLIDKYAMEVESMFPGLKLNSKHPKASGDVDILFVNTLRYLEYLNERLKETSDAMTERIDRAVADLPGDNSISRAITMALTIKDKRTESEDDYKRRFDDLKARNEHNLKDSMKKIKDNHEKIMKQKTKEMEHQVKAAFDKMVDDKVAAEKKIFAAELEEMALKLKVTEAKLDARFKAERDTRRSQELWAAGASLLEATKRGDPIVKVDKELKAIEKASGNDDKLVLTVLKSIPKSVREKGIVPESVLRDGFRAMEKTARSVALVEQDGAPLPVYMLSWLQGLFLFMTLSGIPQREFEKPPLVPPAHLDTFDLLQRASFWLDRGNLAIAVRYVDALKGASRAAATKWFEAARAHLEVRQAAEAILAHAASLGLRYI